MGSKRKAFAGDLAEPKKARKISKDATTAATAPAAKAAKIVKKKKEPEEEPEEEDKEEEEDEEEEDEEEEDEEEEDEEEEDKEEDNGDDEEDEDGDEKEKRKSGEEEERKKDGEESAQAVEKKHPTTFKELGLVDVLCNICNTLGYAQPTPIQAESIPIALAKRDLIGTAETGSGKTIAFALPILQALLEHPRPYFAVVLSPTRELAVQIGETFRSFSEIALRCAVLVGGVNKVDQAISLAKSPHVIVATPGRLLDHLESTKGFSLRRLQYLVIDEADRMLDMDFGPVVQKILHSLPRERRTMLFSATMSASVESLQRASLRDPVRVSAKSAYGIDGEEDGERQTVARLRQSMMLVPLLRKDQALVWLANEYRGQFTVVFTRTIRETQRLAILLRSLGFGAIPMHGKLDQSSRLAALNKIKEGSRDILVATDVAARGLDIPRVSIVINYNLPMDSKTYVHRVGRTARAGKSGHAINLVTQYDFQQFLAIEKAIGMHRKIQPIPFVKAEFEIFRPRVEEAQRIAKRELSELMEKAERRKGRQRHGKNGGGGGSGGRRRGRGDDMDRGEEY